jgi:hypothetical protein
MNSKDSAKFSDSAVEHPTRIVPLVCTKLDDAAIVGLDGGEKFSAGGAHCSETLRELLLAAKFAKLRCEELANSEHRFDAMMWYLHFRWNVQYASVFEERENTLRRHALGFRWIPLDPEDGNT